MDKKRFKKDIKAIENAFCQYWNGFHLGQAEWERFQEALKDLDTLKEKIVKEVGVDEGKNDGGFEWK